MAANLRLRPLRRRWFATAAFAVAATICASIPPARAQLASALPPQPTPVAAGVEVLVTPYVWIPWIGVNVRPADTRISSQSTTIDPGQLYGHLTWVPFMGEAEFRYGDFGLITDYIHAPLKAGVSTRNILFSGATPGLTLDAGTAMFMYRAITLPDQYVDVGAGLRAWGLDGSIALNQGALPAATVTNGLSWADPMITARYHHDIGNGFSATAYGDVGGFGAGAHIDWQVVGTIDYAYNSRIEFHGGLRSLNFSYGAPRANVQMNMVGPILAATFRF